MTALDDDLDLRPEGRHRAALHHAARGAGATQLGRLQQLLLRPQGRHAASAIREDHRRADECRHVIDSGAEAVGGLAAGCIPIADAVARAALDAGRLLPTFFGRAEAKDHGPQELAKMRAAATEDGSPLIRAGRRVAIVEDAVTQGGAAMQATKAAQAAGCNVVLVMTVVERHEGGGARFREIGIPFKRLFYTHDDGSLHVDEELAARVSGAAVR